MCGLNPRGGATGGAGGDGNAGYGGCDSGGVGLGELTTGKAHSGFSFESEEFVVDQGSVEYAGQLLDVVDGAQNPAFMLGFKDHDDFSRSAFLMQFKSGQQRQVSFYSVKEFRPAMHQQARNMQGFIIHFGCQAPPNYGKWRSRRVRAGRSQFSGPGGPRKVSWLIQTMKP